MTEPTAEQINAPIDKFTDIPVDGAVVNTMPNGTRITVWYEYSSNSGFVCNVKSSELGVGHYFAKKWILQSELDGLIGDVLASTLPLPTPIRPNK